MSRLSRNAARPRAAARAGFSLVELLVSIGVIGILIALLLPALSGARQAGRETTALANLRTVATVFHEYAGRYGAWPFRARGTPLEELVNTPPNILMVRWWPEGTIVGISDHFGQAWLWPGIVAPLEDWPGQFRTWVSPGRPAELPKGPWDDDLQPIERVSVVYSNAFVARPGLFRQGAVADESLLRPTRPDEVTFPSQKVMLWDRHLAYRTKEPQRVGEHYKAPTPMAFADMHAELKDPTAAAPGVPNPLRSWLETPLHNTPDGVRGRDY